MNYQKDTYKDRLVKENNSNGHPSVFNKKEHINKDIYSYLFKKTEKLVTALYMVTDCMETDDAIKMRMRLCGVGLLSSVHQIPVLSPVEKHTHLTTVRLQVNELVSLVEIAMMIGFISEMNAVILKKEFSIIVEELEVHQKQSSDGSVHGGLFESKKVSEFVLSNDIFNVDELPFPSSSDSNKNGYFGVKDKRTNTLSFTNLHNTRAISEGTFSRTDSKGSGENVISKQERIDKIKALIKDKKDLPDGEAGVSIKDISGAFTDCSEKTIQRELNTLIAQGQIKKIGAKRWSRYSVVTKD